MEIRSYRPQDEAQIVALWARSLVRDPVTPERFRQMVLLDANYDPEGCLVAIEGGEPIGFALGIVRRQPMDGVGLEEHLGWITAFFVAPERQRQGIGTRLVERLLEFFRARGR